MITKKQAQAAAEQNRATSAEAETYRETPSPYFQDWQSFTKDFLFLSQMYCPSYEEDAALEALLRLLPENGLSTFLKNLIESTERSFVKSIESAVYLSVGDLKSLRSRGFIAYMPGLIKKIFGTVSAMRDYSNVPSHKLIAESTIKKWQDAEFSEKNGEANEIVFGEDDVERYLEYSWYRYGLSLQDAFVFYGQVPTLKRLLEASRNAIPYAVLMFFVGGSISFNLSRPIRHLSQLVISDAYAQAGPAQTGSVKQDIIAYVLLALFVISFCVTLWNEFFSSKPRPISRDFNRAYVGLLIGQLGKIMGS